MDVTEEMEMRMVEMRMVEVTMEMEMRVDEEIKMTLMEIYFPMCHGLK